MSDDTGLTARKIEQILRTGGVSKAIARAIVAHGFKGAADDGAETEAEAELVRRLRAASHALRTEK